MSKKEQTQKLSEIQEITNLEILRNKLRLDELAYVRETEKMKHEWEIERIKIRNELYKNNKRPYNPNNYTR